MAQQKTTDLSTISEEVIDVPISLLRITPEINGVWLQHWISQNGDRVIDSPQYLYLTGEYEPLWEWTRFRKLPSMYFTQRLMAVLKSIILEGQLEPILIYKDMRINTGHKRSAIMLFLGAKTIKARIVPDDYKL